MKLNQLRLTKPIYIHGRGTCDVFDTNPDVLLTKRAKSIEVMPNGHVLLVIDEKNTFFVPSYCIEPGRVEVQPAPAPKKGA